MSQYIENEKHPKEYNGVVVPMVTPLTKSLKADRRAVKRIMRLFANNGISPLICGTTGESPNLPITVSADCVEAAVLAKSEGQTIYAGLIGNNPNLTAGQANRYSECGADVAVPTLPAYYILTPQQMESFYLTVADKSCCPIMIYNIKATTQMSIPIDVVGRLSEHPNIVGLKDSERDEERMKTLISMFRDRADFSYFCGWGAKSLDSLQLGADGVVPSTGNIVPELYKKLIDAFKKGDMDTAEKMQKLTDEVAALYQKDRTLGESLAALKALMNHRSLCSTVMMPPLTEIPADKVYFLHLFDKFIKILQDECN